MANVLNYKYEIFPTQPQKAQLNKILREGRIQWNKAVNIRRKLKTALSKNQIEHVINKCLSSGRSNTQGQRKKAILRKISENLDFDSAARLYDIRNLVGKVLPVDKKHLDISLLARELKEKHKEELEKRKKVLKEDVDPKKLPKLSTYWQLMRAINQYAGFAAKTFMDHSYKSPNGMALSPIRFNISGSKNAHKWNQAVNPTKEQRAYGATGEPQYKRRCDGFTYQIQNTDVSDLIRHNKKPGYQISLDVLHRENRWTNMAYHRPIPNNSTIKQLTVNAKAGRYFAVLSVEVPDSVWKIEPMNNGWHAGIDPGAQIALTVALKNSKNNELRHLAIHYEFLEKSRDKLEKLQQSLAQKLGPRRKRTVEEIDEAISKFAGKSSIRKLVQDEKEKAIAKEKERLERRMIPQEPSNRWIRWRQRVSSLQFKVASRRADVLHKISRVLAEGCDVIGMGDWDPPREISYRKKRRDLKRKVKSGIAGAAEKLKALEEEKSKQGPKGSKKRRRGGRDRAIATLRRLIEEKAERTSATALTDIKEAGSSYTCSVCGKETGPKGEENLSIREWRCKECDTYHHRDLNSAFNILKKTENAAAQAALLSETTGATVAKTVSQGAKTQPVRENGLLATGTSGRGDTFFYKDVPNLWEGEVPKAIKSLMQMRIVRSLTLQSDAEKGLKIPP